MEHTHDHRVDEEHMHEDYRKKEASLEAEAGRLWKEEEAVRARIRANVGLSEEDRLDAYIEAYGGIEKRFTALVDTFGREIGKSVSKATQTLYAGAGKEFSGHLTSAANVPDDRLEPLMATAVRSGQEELARAIAVTAYERGQHALFESWAEADPDRAAALSRLRGTPGAEQLYARTGRALHPPKAEAQDLIPTAEDERISREREAERNRPKVEFFGPRVKRQAGRQVF